MKLILARWLAAGALAASLVGCGVGRHVQKGADRYRHADYPGAMEQWRYLEDREEDMNDKGRVRYLVHRGLTHHRLYLQYGQPEDYANAHHFLARGKVAYDAGETGWLDAKTVVEMKDALAGLSSPVVTPSNGGVVFVAPPSHAPDPSAEDDWEDDD